MNLEAAGWALLLTVLNILYNCQVREKRAASVSAMGRDFQSHNAAHIAPGLAGGIQPVFLRRVSRYFPVKRNGGPPKAWSHNNGRAYLMRSNKSNGSRAVCARGFMAYWTAAGDGARLDGPAGGGGALRVRREWRLQHCVGDRHGHQHGGGHGRGGDCPRWDRRHPGWDTRLRRER